MPFFADLDNRIEACRVAHGIPEEDLIYDWSLSKRQIERLSPYLTGINIEQIGTEDGTVRLFRNFNLELRRTVETDNINETANVIKAIISHWGGINGNKRERLESYARQLNIIGKLSDRGQEVAMEEFYYSTQDGIASWSKILAAWEPDTFFIYDANVAVALQTLYIRRYLFFLPPSEAEAVKTYYRNQFNNLGEAEYVDYRGYCDELRRLGNGNHLEKRLFMLGRRLTR